MPESHLLLVDDNPAALSALKMLLRSTFSTLTTLNKPEQIRSVLEQEKVDVVLLDMNFKAGINSGNEGLFWLQEIKKTNPETEVVMLTAYGDVELAVKALKAGAADFVLKPWNNEKLIATLLSALRLRQSRQEIDRLRQREQSLKETIAPDIPLLFAESKAMSQVLTTVHKIATTDANVLLTGENGTGKEVIAKEIHRLSGRASELLVTVDMGAVAETLFESELFGHVKGAFTDARQDRTGKFQLADKGTLFLDEIGNLPLNMQTRLLSVLQNRMVTPLGSNQNIPVDIRLISATNGSLEDMVQRKEFREDLLYRLNTIHIHIPPLRDRVEDIELLALHFLKLYERRYRKHALKLSTAAIRKLQRHSWPGNVRELQHAIEKAVILSDNDLIQPENFELSSASDKQAATQETLESMEQRLIQNALRQCRDNLTLAAKQLGVTRQTLYNKLKRYEN